jgi:hypothetical protein
LFNFELKPLGRALDRAQQEPADDVVEIIEAITRIEIET